MIPSTVLVVTLAGTVWYAVAPGVTAYQFASVLMLPGLALLVIGAGMKLSVPGRWVAAVAMALRGRFNKSPPAVPAVSAVHGICDELDRVAIRPMGLGTTIASVRLH